MDGWLLAARKEGLAVGGKEGDGKAVRSRGRGD